MDQLKKKNKYILRAYGRQKKGSWEDGYFIKKKAKRPLGQKELNWIISFQEGIPSEWGHKLLCFFGATFMRKESAVVMTAEGPKTIQFEKEYVPFLYRMDSGWKLDSFAIDEEFGPSRLSIEYNGSVIGDLLKSIFK